MQPINDKQALMKKRIPTMVGLGVLVVGLIVGVIFLGTGPGVFAPRATPETTPSKIKLTNVTDAGFTVSFYTSAATPGYIKYGTDSKTIKSQTGDDRDQLSGTVGDYKLHHITVRGLKPSTAYYYVLGTGSNASYDDNGSPFTVKTAARGGAPSAAKTAYGNVLNKSGSPENGAIVYVTLPGVGEMSSLVKSSGSWAIPLSNARKADGSGYATINETDNLTIFVQGTSPSLTSNLTIAVADSQPVADIIAGEDNV
ncbi:MAG: fibronectin type III domain-containing protein, partial [Candidatus Pacebacteria bacterium]|nr:fibronectin type III domain-containing protein [Candidatus Paceibacterota bacterium]